MLRDLGASPFRAVAVAAGAFGLLGVAFASIVAISWTVLSAALGPWRLLLVLAVAGIGTAAWGSVVVAKVLRPARPLSRARRAGVASVTLLAAVTGLIAVPSTRDRLESGKCRRVAGDAVSQVRCRDWLEGRREWWTFGLSHRDPAR